MQRVRIGLTGLAFVFVLVLLAAVFVQPEEESSLAANAMDPAAMNLAVNMAEPQEPLAELGVAPGNADANVVAAPAQ
jgi:hypothetical protein